MKKTLNSILLVLLVFVLVFSATACGNAEAPKNQDGSISSTSESETPEFSPASDGSDDVSEVEKTGLWENATYLSDKEFGEGSKTLVVEIKADDQSVTFTVKTDKSTVGEALLEHELIDGEEGQYGMYIKSVNGIVADFDIDQSYWAFYIDGEYAMTGVDTTEITDGAVYKLERTK